MESNPSIYSGQSVFRGTRIPVAVVVEQLRAGTPREELELDFPQLSREGTAACSVYSVSMVLCTLYRTVDAGCCRPRTK